MAALLLKGSEISVLNKNEILMRQVNPFVQRQEFVFGISAELFHRFTYEQAQRDIK